MQGKVYLVQKWDLPISLRFYMSVVDISWSAWVLPMSDWFKPDESWDLTCVLHIYYPLRPSLFTIVRIYILFFTLSMATLCSYFCLPSHIWVFESSAPFVLYSLLGIFFKQKGKCMLCFIRKCVGSVWVCYHM